MKRFELIATAILVPLDYVVLLAAALSSYFLRFESFVTDIRPVIFSMSLNEFMLMAYPIIVGWLLIFALSGLYTFGRKTLWQEIRHIFFATSTATMIIIVAFFFNAELFSSRFIILAFWVLSFVFVTFERIAVYFIKKLFYRVGKGVRRVVVIGDDQNTFNLIAELKKHPNFGFRVSEHLREFSSREEKYLDRLRDKVIIDEVIQADVNLPAEQKERLYNYCQENHLGFKYVTSLLETKMINFEVNTLGGIPLTEIKHTRLEGWGRIIKRIYDIILSFMGCILLIPLSIIIGTIIKLNSSGPVFVKLKRVGMHGQPFDLYKYRSMVKDAHALKEQLQDMNQRNDGPLFKAENDPRITSIGRWLRKWSVDELPQLFNVLKGDMSLVGPRPHEPGEVDKYESSQRKLLTIKPGITGMAQVSGRSDLLFEEEVRLDSYYIENWSLWLDLQIILKTVWVVLLTKNSA